LSLVSCAVALFPATTSTSRTSFHTLNRETGNRVRRQYIDAVTGKPVDSDNQVRGYEIAKDTYVLVEDEELDAVAIESTHTIDIDRFVKRSSVDERYLDRPYYLAPDDNVAQQAFGVIRDAMEEKKVVGLARVVLQRREHIVMIEPLPPGMMITTLHFDYEVRKEDPYFEDIEKVDTPKEMLDLAGHIMETKAGMFDVSMFEDRYEKALAALIREKQSGRAIKARAPERPSNVVDLMEALRRSLDATRPPARAAAASTKQPALRRSKATVPARKPGKKTARRAG